jgi:hypothetical protein
MTVRIWGMRKVKQSSESDRVAISGEMTVLEGHRNWVTGVSWSPVKLANGHELVATYVLLKFVSLATDYAQCIIRYHCTALGCRHGRMLKSFYTSQKADLRNCIQSRREMARHWWWRRMVPPL